MFLSSPASQPEVGLKLPRGPSGLSDSSDWLTPTALVTLSFVPVVAGAFRLVQLGTGVEITEDNARFFGAPIPVVIHIVSSVIFSLLGAFQFSDTLRRHRPGWHRNAGRLLVLSGIASALSGLWMTQFYPTPEFDGGHALYAIRLIAGSAMAVFLMLGVVAVYRGDVHVHRAWMMRGYALGVAAGTQVLTHLPWFVFPSIHGELARTLPMAAGWAINVGVAEWFISRQRQTAHRMIAAERNSHS